MTAPLASPPPVPPPGSGATQSTQAIRLGLGAFVLGLVGMAGGGLGVLMTANTCGMFADHCTDDGKTGAGADLFVLLFMFSVALALLGVCMVIIGAVTGRGR